MSEVAESLDITELHGCPTTVDRGQEVVFVPRERWIEVVDACKADGYSMCVDVTAVDYGAAPEVRNLPPSVRPERFEVVANLLDHSQRRRTRLRTQVPATDPTVSTLFDIHPGTEAMEREVFDLMGIAFDGHPDLSRILMPEDWEGHPLRKDYAQGRIPVQFKFPVGAYTEEETQR